MSLVFVNERLRLARLMKVWDSAWAKAKPARRKRLPLSAGLARLIAEWGGVVLSLINPTSEDLFHVNLGREHSPIDDGSQIKDGATCNAAVSLVIFPDDRIAHQHMPHPPRPRQKMN